MTTATLALPESISIITNTEQLQTQFEYLHNLSREQPILDWSQRLTQLDNLEVMLADNKDNFAAAISADFGHRSVSETQFAELFTSFMGINHAKKHGKSWMKTRRAGIPAIYRPARNEIQPQPLGVVGIMVPWNYPLNLAIGPMIDALTAGNRIMIKISEAVPIFANAFAEAISHYFSPDMIKVVVGEMEMSQAFSHLPFDHLLFTGSTSVGRKIMAAAAPNLTPVTLELGGKSPVIVLENANLEAAVSRIMMGKTLNAGQTCIAPDYVLLHERHHAKFIALAKDWMQKHYPNIENNKDYTHIINDEQFKRIQGYLAKLDSTYIHELTATPANEGTRLMPPVIVEQPPLDSEVMSEELFAPILPLIHFDRVRDAVSFVNARPRPLALYIFGDDYEDTLYIREHTVSGGICVNEVILQVAQHDIPFGGVGASGMGAYHGKAGFERLSHMKPIFVQSKLNAMSFLLPPYGTFFNKGIGLFLK
ncbi:coniferyl aldehyde dehydrogenase [Psychrobacter pygoscelis]|uniref:coniferyl aldehyde dehydrogenase n=1 Tax=Psychrobacter pygoscelis TaxID=2488563 RepID=UPI00103A8D2A|nr:coniferyl aldehyde dehydrogenase [Psychrobacter pygoscelis]